VRQVLGGTNIHVMVRDDDVVGADVNFGFSVYAGAQMLWGAAVVVVYTGGPLPTNIDLIRCTN
jgi:hypothetical protein